MKPRQKDFWREIAGGKLRFLSLFSLIAIGVFVLVGLTVTGPIMRRTVSDTLKASNAYDLKLSVKAGLEDEDLKRIDALTGVRDSEYFHRAFLQTDGRKTLDVSSMPRRITRPVIVEGKAPISPGEILLDRSLKDTYAIGEKLHFVREEDPLDPDAPPVLNRYDFTVTGFATSAEYLDESEKGTTQKGDKIDGFAYIPPLDFRDPTITDAHFQFKDLEGVAVGSAEYSEKNASHRKGFEEIFRDRPEARLSAELDEKRADIAQGRDEIDEGYRELEDGKKEIQDAAAQVAHGEKELEDGRRAYAEGIAEGEKTLAASLDSLRQARKSILFQEDRLSVGERALLDGKSRWEAAAAELADSRGTAIAGLSGIEDAFRALKEEEALLAEARKKLETSPAPADPMPPLPYTEAEVAAFQRESKEIADALPAAESNLRALEAERDRRRQMRDALAEEIGIADAEAAAGHIAALEKQIAQADADIARLRETAAAEGEEIEEKLRALEGERAALVKKRDALADERDAAKNHPRAPEYAQAKKDAEAAESTYAAAQQQLAKDEARIRTLEEKIAAQKAAERKRREISKAAREKNAAYERELAAQKDELARAKAELEEKARLLEEKKRELETKRTQGEGALQEIEAAEAELARNKAALASREEEIRAGKAQLILVKEALGRGEAEYAAGASELEEKRRTGAAELDAAAKELWQGRSDLEAARREYAEREPEALRELKEGSDDLDRAEELLTVLRKPTYTITPANEETKVYTFLDYAKRIDLLAGIFPVFLFAIALLLASTVTNRMVEEQRIQIGTYKALGYGNMDIAAKYVKFGSLAALLGGIPGALAGNFFLSRVIADAYFSGGAFFGLSMGLYPLHIVLAIAAGILATGLIAFLSVRGSLTERTATLLLPKQPAKGTRIFLERIRPLWARMTFLQKVTSRNLFRDKKRMAMTVIGVMGCMALLVLGFGIRTSVDGLVDKQFGEITRFDHILLYEPLLSPEDHDAYRQEIAKDPDILRRATGRLVRLRVPYSEGLTQPVNLIVPETEAALEDVVVLRDPKTKAAVDLTDGAVITEKLAKIMKLSLGDSIRVKDEDDKFHDIPVAAITEGYAGHYMYMNRTTYERVFAADYKANTDLVYTAGKDIARYRDYDSVTALLDTSGIRHIVEQVTDNIGFIVLVILVASSTLAVVVLSTLTSINIQERRREISTIRVLGFYPEEVTAYIYRETGVLTAVGILVGCVVGKYLHALVISLVVPDGAMLDPALGAANYLIPVAITLAISVVLMFYFHRKLQKIDMVEALKGVE